MFRVALFVAVFSLLSTSLYAAEKDLAIDVASDGKAVNADVGQTITVTLSGNITTGYGWVVEAVAGESLQQVGEVKYVATPNPDRRVGAGGVFIATFKAAKAGKADLKMAYKRPWEKDKAPAKTFAVTVDVQAAK